jgi:hypothetical protein
MTIGFSVSSAPCLFEAVTPARAARDGVIGLDNRSVVCGTHRSHLYLWQLSN